MYSGKGIGEFNFAVFVDHAISFDGSSSGRRDHLFLYTPGSGRCWVMRHAEDGSFQPIYAEDNEGIAGWDFGDPLDRAIAYDLDHSGKMDAIVCYRPTQGGCCVIRHNGNGNFESVYEAEPVPPKPGIELGKGIAGWNLSLHWERMHQEPRWKLFELKQVDLVMIG